MPPEKRIAYDERRRRRPPMERAQVSCDFDELPWLAARYSFANDEACYWPLWHGLVFQAQRRASREKWPPVVRGCPPRGAPPGVRGGPQFYLHELAALVLDEVACGPVFAAAPALRAIYLGIDDDACARVVEPYYRSLQAVYDRWLDVARGQIRAWTNC